MKKEIIIIFVIIVTIVIAHVTSQIYVQNYFNSISAEISKIEEKLFDENHDNKELMDDMANLQKKWKDKYDFFACFIEHDELEKVQIQLISMEANIKVEDYEKTIDEAEKCKFILRHIEEKDSLKIVNVL